LQLMGFGRIGRLVFRAIEEQGMIRQDRSKSSRSATLSRPITWHTSSNTIPPRAASRATFPPGNRPRDKPEDDILVVNGRNIHVVSAKDPSGLPWKALGVQLVIDPPAFLPTAKRPRATLRRAQKKVIISAPAKE